MPDEHVLLSIADVARLYTFGKIPKSQAYKEQRIRADIRGGYLPARISHGESGRVKKIRINRYEAIKLYGEPNNFFRKG